VPLFIDIPDAMIAAYMPVTGRLMQRYRNNLMAIPYVSLANTHGDLSGTTTSTSYVTLFTVRLFVPDFVIGAGGTRLEFFVKMAVSGGTPPSYNSRASFKIGANTSAEHSGGPSETSILALDWTPTGNTVVDVEFQGKSIDSGHTTEVELDSFHGAAAGGREWGRLTLLDT
jgi:hypothetical protein